MQMKKIKKEDFFIASAYIVYLAYGDTGDMTDEEISAVDNFCADIAKMVKRKKAGGYHFSFGEEELEYCHISGLLATCTKVSVVYMPKK